MDNKILYERLLCKAQATRSGEIVYGFLELDEDKDKWCMCVMIDKDGDYTSDLANMWTTHEYIDVVQDTIEFISG